MQDPVPRLVRGRSTHRSRVIHPLLLLRLLLLGWWSGRRRSSTITPAIRCCAGSILGWRGSAHLLRGRSGAHLRWWAEGLAE